MLHNARQRSKIHGKRLDEATFPQISLYSLLDKSSALHCTPPPGAI